MISKEREAILRAIAQASPFNRMMGLAIEALDEGFARVVMPCPEDLMQLQGVVHGGALATLADSAVAFALSTLIEANQRISTIEMKINYLAPVTEGPAVAEARILRKGRRVAVGDVDIYDGQGRLVAKSLMSYSIHTLDTGIR